MADDFRLNVENEEEVPASSFDTQGGKYLFALFGGQFVRISIDTLKENFAAGGSTLNALNRSDILMIAQNVLDENEEITGKEINNITVEKLAAALFSIMQADNSIATTDTINTLLQLANFVKDVEVSQDGTKLIITYFDDDVTELPYVASGGGLSFDSGYVDEDGKVHLTKEGEDIEGFDPFVIPAGSGGSGGGSKLTFSLLSGTSLSFPESETEANVKIRFTSIDTETSESTGQGTLQIYVGGILKRTLTVQQGDSDINIRDYAVKGANAFRFVLTDGYGATASRNCTVNFESLTLAWTLDSTIKNTGNLDFSLIPTGTGEKTVIVTVDGEEYSRDTVTTSGRRLGKSISGLTHGGHIVKAYCTLDIAGNEIKSNELVCAVAQVDESNATPVIAAALDIDSVVQFTTLSFAFRIIDSSNNPTTISLLANEKEITTFKVDQSEQIWTYRPTAAGTLKLEIVCGVSRWTKTITVEALTAPVSEVTDNLEYKLDPSAMTSLEGLTLSANFDTINGGLITDESGIRCLKIIKGDRVTIPFAPFADDTRKSGKELKIIYKVDNCSDFDATAISCMDAGIGFEIQANKCSLKSELTTIEMQTCEGIKSELEFNIEPDNENRLLLIWEKGNPAKMLQYAEGDNFTQNTPKTITVGSDDCNVYLYLMRCYSSNLSKEEMKSNFIYDGADGAEIDERYKKSLIYDNTGNIDPEKCAEVNPDAHVFVWHAAGISTSKTNKITGTLTHKYINGGSAHTWTAPNAIDKVQGTSSAAYILAGLNHDFEAPEGFIIDESGETIEVYSLDNNYIPVNYFNFKDNVASSENINNLLISEWYNRFQPYIREARANDPRIRDCIGGQMAMLFYHNTGTEPVQAGSVIVSPGETIFYGVGCINNSKKNYNVFAQNDEDDIIVIEGNNNTSAQNRFKSDDLSNETWDDDGSYQFRYLSNTITKEEAATLWQRVLSFVVSCDPEQATDETLPSSVTYNGVVYNSDSAAYRKAKFEAEADDYFIMDSIIYHQVFTTVFTMCDNRAKNMFWGYSKKHEKWHLNFSYDHDTAMGNDNEGGLTLRYGYLDTDTIGTKSVFNAADNTLFVLNATVFHERLRDMFISRENLGAWDLEAFGRLCDEYQEKICTELWVADSYRKYIDPLVNKGSSAYLSMGNGKKRLQRWQFLKFQRAFISSYYIGTYATSNTGQIRGYTPDTWAGVSPESKITLTPYCDLFITVKAGSETLQQRAKAGEAVTLTFEKVGKMNDTEIYPYSAPFIQDIGDISCLYPGFCDLSAFTRLRRAKIGSSVVGYQNTNFTEIKVDNCISLEELNIENCPAFIAALDLTKNLMLKNLYTRGTNTSGVSFASGGRIVEALLNGVVSITAKHLYYVNNLSLADYDNLSTLIVEDAPSLDTQSIVEMFGNINRIRLLEVLWNMPNSNTLIKVSKIKGIDDDGYGTDVAVLTGVANVMDMSETRQAQLEKIFPQLDINVENHIPEYTVKFVLDEDGLDVYDTQIVERGTAAERPTNPTKPSSISTDFAFAGWAGSYNNILQDTVIKAVWNETIRQYNVRWINQSTIIQEDIVDYGGNCYYNGEDLVRNGYLWTGWDKSAENVSSDMEIRAVYEAPALPSEVRDLSNYDYIVSDYPEDSSAYTYGELYAICAAGLGKTYFSVGDKVRIKFAATKTIVDAYAICRLDGFNHYRLADGSALANTTWSMIGALVNGGGIHSTNTNIGGWDMTTRRAWLNDTVLMKAIPPVWRSIFKLVQVRSTIGNSQEDFVISNDKLFFYSYTDVGFGSQTPYGAEVDPEAETKALAYYSSSTNRIKKTYNGTGSVVNWWLRSPWAGSSTNFAYVHNGGNSGNYGATGGNSFSFGFCI